MNAPAVRLRPIGPADDAAIGAVIRTVMPEFGAAGPGFALHDPEVDWMSRAYAAPRAAYFVVERDGLVLGGGGIAPLAGGHESICELRKMYFLPEIRGFGLGRALLRRCLEAARSFGYRTCYLETLGGMDAAAALYAKLGFERLRQPMGATGHFGCNRYYALDLERHHDAHRDGEREPDAGPRRH
jgi:putative acetyltransferase